MPDAIYYFDCHYQQELGTRCVGEKWEELVWNEATDEILINREKLRLYKEFINVFLTLVPSGIICTIGRYEYFLPSPSCTPIVLELLAIEMSAKLPAAYPSKNPWYAPQHPMG